MFIPYNTNPFASPASETKDSPADKILSRQNTNIDGIIAEFSNSFAEAFKQYFFDELAKTAHKNDEKCGASALSEPKENPTQTLIVRYKKNAMSGDDVSWVEVEYPDGRHGNDEVALCVAIAKLLNEDIPEIPATKTAKVLSSALLEHLSEFMCTAIKEAMHHE